MCHLTSKLYAEDCGNLYRVSQVTKTALFSCRRPKPYGSPPKGALLVSRTQLPAPAALQSPPQPAWKVPAGLCASSLPGSSSCGSRWLLEWSEGRFGSSLPLLLPQQLTEHLSSQKMCAEVAKEEKEARCRFLTAGINDCWKHSLKDSVKLPPLEDCSRIDILNHH